MPEKEYINKIREVDPNLVELIFEKGLKEGFKHSEPSPETALRLNRLEEDVKKLTEAFTLHSREVIEHSERRDENLAIMMKEFKEGMIEVKRITELLSKSSFAANIFWKIALAVGGLVTFGLATYIEVRQIIGK